MVSSVLVLVLVPVLASASTTTATKPQLLQATAGFHSGLALSNRRGQHIPHTRRKNNVLALSGNYHP
jgi:hypothetical protein